MSKILVSGFKLESAEKNIADNIIKNYKTKFERIGFEYLKLSLKQKPHHKEKRQTLYELRGILKTKKVFTSKSDGKNLYLAMVRVLDKLLHEAQHKIRDR